MLAPRDSRSREARRLDGLWRFKFDPGAEGSAGRWWERRWGDAREMAVPASYNDLVTDTAEREHVGDVWYQRDVLVPASWAGRRIVVRCDAATHRGTVWAGDVEVADHAGRYTPFEGSLASFRYFGARIARSGYGCHQSLFPCDIRIARIALASSFGSAE